MSSVQEHYESLLAKHYIWMVGVPFDEKVREQRVLIEKIVKDFGASKSLGLALDLGSGPGFQSIRAVRLGTDGNISLPGIPPIHAEGLSIGALEAQIVALYKPTVPTVKVWVSILDQNPPAPPPPTPPPPPPPAPPKPATKPATKPAPPKAQATTAPATQPAPAKSQPSTAPSTRPAAPKPATSPATTHARASFSVTLKECDS